MERTSRILHKVGNRKELLNVVLGGLGLSQDQTVDASTGNIELTEEISYVTIDQAAALTFQGGQRNKTYKIFLTVTGLFNVTFTNLTQVQEEVLWSVAGEGLTSITDYLEVFYNGTDYILIDWTTPVNQVVAP